MDRDREPGQTYALENVGFFDFETRANSLTAELKSVGTYRYACEADAIILATGISAGQPIIDAVPDFGGPLVWERLHPSVHAHHARVVRGEAIWGAWNSSFDRAIWNYSTVGFPRLEPHHVIDVAAQATVGGYAPDLAKASIQAGGEAKLETGKGLIRLFCLPGSTATPQSHPLEWAEFCRYAGVDISSMRDVFLRTRQLPLAEWKELWASEKINERGIAIDLPMVEHAARLAEEDARRSRVELPQLTSGHVTSVNQVARISSWLLKSLPVQGREILTKVEEEIDDDGLVTRPAKFSLTRPRVEKLIAFCAANPGLELQQRVLEVRLYGGSKASAKFAKIKQQHVDGKMFGMFVFNGAPQTGRYSSKGPQFQNITRNVLPYEYEAIEALLRSCNYDELAALGDDSPVARKLALLVRPAFIAPEGKTFVWSDWSQIEARILPWLAGNDDGARDRLQIFREVDANPKLPDLYKRSAAAMSHLPVEMIDKSMRQRGKIAELSLGYGGAVGALQGMAANYGMYLSDEEAKTTVDSWREANGWAVDFWNRLMDAAEQAMLYPGVLQRAGRSRISYVYLDGSLLAILPSGRVLTYRNIKYESVEDLDDDDKPTGKFTTHLRCSRGHSRIKLWRGIFAENVTQAVAADFLRGTLCRLEDEGYDIVGHVHDEIILECDEDNVGAVTETLREVMQQGFDWSEGLPLMSEETTNSYYTKAEW